MKETSQEPGKGNAAAVLKKQYLQTYSRLFLLWPGIATTVLFSIKIFGCTSVQFGNDELKRRKKLRR